MTPDNPVAEQGAATLSSPAPVSLSSRIEALDVLRGIAVLAAMFVVVWMCGGFSEQNQMELLLRSKGWNYRVFGAMDLLLDGKMRALIALVFGAAMVLFLTKETEPGKQQVADVFIKRQLWLIIFGVVNAVLLLWPQDVLFHLGVIGIMLFPFFRMRPRGLMIAALFVTAIYCGKQYWKYADDIKARNKYIAVTALEKKFEEEKKNKTLAKSDTLTAKQKQEKGAWEGKIASLKVDFKKDEPTTKAMRSGSWAKTYNHLLPSIQQKEAGWTYQYGVWDFASMILLGMLLYKIGFFTNRFSTNRYALIALAGIGGGLLLGWLRLHYSQLALQDYNKYITTHKLPFDFLFPVERAGMVIGYASVVLACLSASLFNGVWRVLASVGRLSLTNYLMQTVICTIFFYGYGMGYYGRFSQFELYFFAAEVVMVQVVFSILWTKAYNYGPAEWLLRRLSAGKWLPKRMRKPVEPESALPVFS